MQLEEPKDIGSNNRIAVIITEVLSPPLVGLAVLGIICSVTTSSWREFLMWWTVTAGAISVAPLAFVLWGVRNGRFSDHHITQREQRTWPFLFGLTSVCAAIAAMMMFNAPREILAVAVTSMVGGLVLFALTRITKPSMHTATVAGSTVMLVIHFGPYTLPILILIPLVGWGRMKVRAHTLHHVVLGGATGALAAAILFGFIKQYL